MSDAERESFREKIANKPKAFTLEINMLTATTLIRALAVAARWNIDHDAKFAGNCLALSQEIAEKMRDMAVEGVLDKW